jgi:hypothetical protein
VPARMQAAAKALVKPAGNGVAGAASRLENTKN